MSEILLIRQEKRSIESAKSYLKNGLKCTIIPCSRLAAVKYNILNAPHPTPYNIVITSSNAIVFLPDKDAVAQVICIGNNTYNRLVEKGYNAVLAGQNSFELKSFLQSNCANSKLLYFRAKDINSDLASDKYFLLEIICYEIIYFTNDSLAQATMNKAVKYMPIYSANSAKLINKINAKNTIFVAISNGVAKHLLNHKDVIVAKLPNEGALIKAILEHKRHI